MKTFLHPLILLLLALGLAPASMRAQGVEQQLRPGDSIIVKLSGVPAEEVAVVSNTYDVSDKGTINLPYIGEVRASGLRPSTLQKNIEGAYKSADVYTHPTIQVALNTANGGGTQVIYVSGEVKTPRAVPITPGMTVHDAITAAGGPTDFANMRKVKHTRSGATRLLDLKKADGPDAQIPAQPGDKVHLPQ
jgi:polysaccharide export outer membrane protein